MGNYFAYMRISTKEERAKQKYTRQENAIDKYAKDNGIHFVFKAREDASGKNFTDRPIWQDVEALLHSGDTVVFKDLSRFTREFENGFNKYMQLLNAGVNIVFLDNPTISTDYIREMLNVAGQMEDHIAQLNMRHVVELLLKVELDRAERERLLISQRTKDGLAASDKKAGRAIGHLDKLSPELKEDLKRYKL